MKRILSALLALVLLFSLLSCRPADKRNGTDETSYGIHTESQAQYLADLYTRANKYAKGNAECSRPLPVTLCWEEDLAEGSHLLISENEALDGCRKIPVSGKSADVYNLKIGTKYYFAVSDPENVRVGSVKSFTTDPAAPRNLFVDGVTNARDLGGWAIEGGGSVRQGMIYRTAKYSADTIGTPVITAEGIRVMTEELGIRTEIDLRRTDNNEYGSLTESPLGSAVSYVSFPMQSSGNIMTLNEEKLPALFAIFGNEENYPIAFHCSIGTDRTGYVAFLLNALLGVSAEDLFRDYLFSNFADIGGTRYASVLEGYIDGIAAADGATLAERTYRYLVGVGVDPADLDRYITLMKVS